VTAGMNDYADHAHARIDAMLWAGDPTHTAEWADRARVIGRSLAVAAGRLRAVIARVPAAWSDGPASDRMIADLTVVAGHLEQVADLLTGQPASCAGLVSDAVTALAAAQGPAPLQASVGSGLGDIGLGRTDGRIILLDAPRLAAGERATQLDDRYRTALARLPPPPGAPREVLDAAGIGAHSSAEASIGPTGARSEAQVGAPIDQDPATSAATPGMATNPAMGVGAVPGLTGGWRHTWLVEDRDLYGTGPSVQPVIGGVLSVET